MNNRQISADEIRRPLVILLNNGQYAVGSRIPPARLLAKELGANRNTIGKVFQELARDGVVSLVLGRGGGTLVQRADTLTTIAAGQLRASLQPLVQQAHTSGLSKALVRDVAHYVIDKAYDARANCITRANSAARNCAHSAIARTCCCPCGWPAAPRGGAARI